MSLAVASPEWERSPWYIHQPCELTPEPPGRRSGGRGSATERALEAWLSRGIATRAASVGPEVTGELFGHRLRGGGVGGEHAHERCRGVGVEGRRPREHARQIGLGQLERPGVVA